MSNNLDKSLADVIASRPKNKRRSARRASAKSTLVGSPPATQAQGGRVPKQTQPQVASAPHAEKIIVSNLPTDVNEAQIKELFSIQIGPTREVTLHYDNAGRSKGIASVLFSKRGDGTKAYQQYHNRLIDGKRPMKVEIVLDPAKALPTPTLSQRVAPAPAPAVAAATTVTTQGVTRKRKGARGRGVWKKGTQRPAKSAEDLDAEMADYTGGSTTVAAS